MWGSNDKSATIESEGVLSTIDEVASAISSKAGDTNSDYVVIFLVDKLSTSKLVNTANSLTYVKHQVLSHS